MSHITKERIIELIKESVKFYPTTGTRPNTFAMINGLSDFNLDNLGYIAEDLKGPDVWTRTNQTSNSFKLTYPMVGVIMMESNISDMIGHTIRILYADRIGNGKTPEGKRKTQTDILNDTVRFFSNLIAYFDDCSFYEVTRTDNSTFTGILSWSYLLQLLNDDQINAATKKSQADEWAVFNMAIAGFGEMIINYISYPITDDMIIGGYAEVRFAVPVCESEDFSFYDDGQITGNNKTVYAGK